MPVDDLWLQTHQSRLFRKSGAGDSELCTDTPLPFSTLQKQPRRFFYPHLDHAQSPIATPSPPHPPTSPQITAHLFEAEDAPAGLDLGAINVQRGRDHGLPSYNAWRRHCGLQPVASFEELKTVMQQPSQLEKVQELYR